MVLGVLLLAAVFVGLVLGFLARLPARQMATMCVAMAGAVLVFYGLVSLLGPTG